MNIHKTQLPAAEKLAAAGLLDKDVSGWIRAQPGKTGRYSSDRTSFSAFWKKSSQLIGQLTPNARRDRAVAGIIRDAARETRARFLRAHVDTIYDALT